MDYNRAQMIGYRMGEEKGRSEGKLEGKIEGKLEAITNLMTNLHMSIEKTLDALGIPETEWNEYIEKLDCKNERMIA